MKKLSILSLLLVTLLLPYSCTEEQPVVTPPGGGTTNNNDWLIPQNNVLDGGPGKDGIPALDAPDFIDVNQVDFLDDDDLVIGFKVGNDVRAYPHPILDWHEIINDDFGNIRVAITYCPLTGTGIGWDRDIDGGTTTFGVSGLLYNTNLIPYDRATDSNWSQMLLESVQGKMAGTAIETHQVVETTWGTWKELYPQSKVVSTETGWSRNYDRYPYGDYRTNNNSLFFPVGVNDSRLPAKERVLGVISATKAAKAYRFSSMPDNGVGVFTDVFREYNLVIVGSQEANFMQAYVQPEGLTFEPVQDKLPIVMRDDEGNTWNIFGEAVAGPRMGQKLLETRSFIGYWVAWGAFYEGLAIFEP
ncbi:MAG: DUF3179 domain-containing protein [Saprospiraceae bacterium]|nr:DUF3179 domain-containing protein [Saprospiraceae bacterium]